MSTFTPPLRAGVIGTNWGRVHIAGLRQAGCTVESLMAHDAEVAARIAAEEQVPQSGTRLEVFSGCDLVAVATPTASHLGYLQTLAGKAVLCEKPLGMTPDNASQFDALNSPHHFISYPFAFLDTAQALKARIAGGQFGTLQRIVLTVGVNLPYPKSPVEWFAEDVVHPFSFVYSLFDDIRFQQVTFGQGNQMTVQYRAQDALFDVLLCDWPKPGLHFDLLLIGSDNAYQLRGGFRPERGWWFEPLLEDGQPITAGEPVELNPWIRANHRVANEVVSVLTGQHSAAAGQAAGLFDVPRARAMEQLFLPLWQAAGATTHTDTAPVAAGLAWQVKG